uniref:C-type lectin domain-containing protein n=1 Tax=Pundamilia nyererei TaxID=303518 RepID=A0A3B4H1C8_9CICH
LLCSTNFLKSLLSVNMERSSQRVSHVYSSHRFNSMCCFFFMADKLILIKENKTWEEALDYCRIFHRGLVSITNLQEQGWVQDKAKNGSSPFVWLGLRYSCTLDLWFWINDKVVCYEKWSREGKTEECDVAVGMQSGEQYEWVSQRDNETYNFVLNFLIYNNSNMWY